MCMYVCVCANMFACVCVCVRAFMCACVRVIIESTQLERSLALHANC